MGVFSFPSQELVVSEEVELIVESLLGVLLRTILEISNRPQPAGTSMRLQFQDVTVCVFYCVCVCVCKLAYCYKCQNLTICRSVIRLINIVSGMAEMVRWMTM